MNAGHVIPFEIGDATVPVSVTGVLLHVAGLLRNFLAEIYGMIFYSFVNGIK